MNEDSFFLSFVTGNTFESILDLRKNLEIVFFLHPIPLRQ